jgi:hypothetical protein
LEARIDDILDVEPYIVLQLRLLDANIELLSKYEKKKINYFEVALSLITMMKHFLESPGAGLENMVEEE